MNQAYAKNDKKRLDELFQEIDRLEKILGPEYIALMDGLQGLGPENQQARCGSSVAVASTTPLHIRDLPTAAEVTSMAPSVTPNRTGVRARAWPVSRGRPTANGVCWSRRGLLEAGHLMGPGQVSRIGGSIQRGSRARPRLQCPAVAVHRPRPVRAWVQ